MRNISTKKIKDTVAQLCIQANTVLRSDVLSLLKSALRKEKSKRPRYILDAIIQNAEVAAREKLPICQDTGIACVFVQIGCDVRIKGDLIDMINRGVRLGYTRGYLRSSVVCDPIKRAGKSKSIPSVVHIKTTRGKRLKITVMPKGFGSENVSKLWMLKPTDGASKIKDVVVESAQLAGPDACPPFIVGVGVGGTAERAMELSKEALILPLNQANPKRHIAKLEREILRQINTLGIGPMGMGGHTTALSVKILTYPTHIAGLPVAVNISCHALRSATAVL